MQLFCQTCTNPTHYWIRKVPAVISNEIPSEWKAAIFSELQAQIVYKSDGAIAFVFCQQAAWRCGRICLFADTAAIWKSDKRCVTANNAPSEISTAKKKKKKTVNVFTSNWTRGAENTTAINRSRDTALPARSLCGPACRLRAFQSPGQWSRCVPKRGLGGRQRAGRPAFRSESEGGRRMKSSIITQVSRTPARSAQRKRLAGLKWNS